jgi:hypothetical protein
MPCRGGLSAIDYTVRVTDRNLPNRLTSGADTSAF